MRKGGWGVALSGALAFAPGRAPADQPENCRDIQEIKIQEQVNKLAVGNISAAWNAGAGDLLWRAWPKGWAPIRPTVRLDRPMHIPRSIPVVLEDDLVDRCKAGDDVTITCGLHAPGRSFAGPRRLTLRRTAMTAGGLVENPAVS